MGKKDTEPVSSESKLQKYQNSQLKQGKMKVTLISNHLQLKYKQEAQPDQAQFPSSSVFPYEAAQWISMHSDHFTAQTSEDS